MITQEPQSCPSPGVPQEEGPLRQAWASLRRSGFVAPELPAVVFVGAASSAGFWWGLALACVVLALVFAARSSRSLPLRTIAGGVVGLVCTVTITAFTGVAADGLLADICIDLALGLVLACSVAARRPLFDTLWRLIRRQPLQGRPGPDALRIHGLATSVAGLALLARATALGLAYWADEPVDRLLALKVVLGLPGTLLVIASFYAAGGLSEPALAPQRPEEGRR